MIPAAWRCAHHGRIACAVNADSSAGCRTHPEGSSSGDETRLADVAGVREFWFRITTPGIDEELRQLGLPVLTPGERLSQVRDAVTSLRDLDGPDLHTPVAMAVRGPKARALAIDLADTVTFAAMPGDSWAEIMRMAADFRAIRDVELALHVPVVGDAVSPFMAFPDTDPAALRAADSLSALPADPTVAIEEVLRRREEGGFSYFVVGANAADALAPVVAELTGH